jgi:hypothetical protein
VPPTPIADSSGRGQEHAMLCAQPAVPTVSASPSVVLRVEGVEKSFHRRIWAAPSHRSGLAGATLEVHAGKLVGLVGEALRCSDPRRLCRVLARYQADLDGRHLGDGSVRGPGPGPHRRAAWPMTSTSPFATGSCCASTFVL